MEDFRWEEEIVEDTVIVGRSFPVLLFAFHHSSGRAAPQCSSVPTFHALHQTASVSS